MKFSGAAKFFSSLSGSKNSVQATEVFPLLPLRELVLFPNTVLPVFITYKAGICAIDEALKRERRLFASCIRNAETGETYPAGTVASIIQYLRLPDNSYRAVLQGEYRAIIDPSARRHRTQDVALVKVSPVGAAYEQNSAGNAAGAERDGYTAVINALMRSVQKSFSQYAGFTRKISAETLVAIEKSERAEQMVNIICNSISLKPEKKAELLSIEDTRERLETLLETLEIENEIFGIQKNISGNVRNRVEKTHREYILREQLKEIHKELGKDTAVDEFADLEHAIEMRNPGEEVLLKARKELSRLRKLQPLSPESGVIRTYLEWLADIPWTEASDDIGDLARAERILNEDHYAMKKAKERIVEFIAVYNLLRNEEENKKDLVHDAPYEAKTHDMARRSTPNFSAKGPILCLVGPPGTGKTSLGKSIARCLGRKFVRMSLGGVRDEAEIRGHRKTYVGALPGRIIQSMRKAGSVNPVFLLDEIDKMSGDFRGDPASALLEVLDPEQNATFMDHYLEVPYDLSKTLFITTANSLHTIPYPLLDRMEIIDIPGYGENEKLAIAKQFLIPRQLAENGLKDAKIIFKDETIREIIRHWTMESGVRSLEREIARCTRRLALYAVEKGFGAPTSGPALGASIGSSPDNGASFGATKRKYLSEFRRMVKIADLEKLLNRRKYKDDVVFKEARIGVSYGLAWTETGGAMLPVETVCFPGSGELIITGNVGDVMKESGRIALSYIRSVQSKYKFKQNIAKTDFHIHVPEGAIPKDGPSAGIALASSLLSSLCQVPPKSRVAMTGELTLTGRVLPIGGLKEKLLAAIRNGMDMALIPTGNKEDWEDLDKDIHSALLVAFIENAEDTFKALFNEDA
ncbi:MAG: endopeptidase La [Treponema sp.]|jgi:ATP-dependent Lon protease|nr:endopeptidase La [Treponema sp.]